MSQLTKEQELVVNAPSCNLVVSAAAGSGKTRVMVEHIIKMIETSVAEGTDASLNIDDMLVMTFTDAAAASMKEKISKALLQAAETNPAFKEQISRLSISQITTIDAFLKNIVMDNITDIADLDSSFRLMDSAEEKMLFKDSIKLYLEKRFEKINQNSTEPEDQQFKLFVDLFSTAKNIKQLEETLETVYDKLMQFAQPFAFLKENVQKFENPLVGLKDIVFEYIISSYNKAKNAYDTIANIHSDFLDKQNENYKKNLDLLSGYQLGLDNAKTFLDVFQNSDKPFDFCGFWDCFSYSGNGGSFKSAIFEDASIIAILKKNYDILKETFKANFKRKADENFYSKEFLTDFYQALLGLQNFIIGFDRFYKAQKASKNVASFNDIEHFALNLLKDENGNDTDLAKAYQAQYKLIFVDECQDVNDVQNTIIDAISGHNKNVFRVGDIKQSIYRFRGALPQLFSEKIGQPSATLVPNQDNTVLLNMNFRSHPDVLETTNVIFDYLFTKCSNPQIVYDPSKDRLVPGKDKKDFEPSERKHVELVSLEEKDINFEKQAKWIAQDIRNKLDSGMQVMYDLNSKALRPLSAGDITILKRSTTNFDVLTKALAECGIDSVCSKGYSFFDAPEIQQMLSLLRVLDNPYSNIEMVGALHAINIFGFTAQDLADLRLIDVNEKYFYNLLKRYKELKSTKLQNKCQDTLTKIERWSKASRFLSIHDLLVNIYNETNYYLVSRNMKMGKQRTKNLDLLLEKSINFERTIYSGLFSFLEYLEQIKKNEETLEEASLVNEGQDAVQMMTIHKSKGLEFPLVYVVGLEGGENKKDQQSGILVDKNVGITLKPKNAKGFVPLVYDALYAKTSNDLLSERECLLYVAMTRAIDTLVLVSHESPKQDAVTDDPTDWKQLQDLNTYLKWIKVIKEQQKSQLEQYCLIRDDAIEDMSDEEQGKVLRTPPKTQKLTFKGDEKDMSKTYPYSNEAGLKVRISVSELKKSAKSSSELDEAIGDLDQTPFIDTYHPSKDNVGTIHGNAFHKFMAHADFHSLNNAEEIQKQINLLVQPDKNIFTQEEFDSLDIHEIEAFTQSDLFKRMQKAKIYREKPFIMSMTLAEIQQISPKWQYLVGLAGPALDNKVMLQGIIDSFFEEEGQMVLIDYKTDKTLDDERKAMYSAQMMIYQKALEAAGYKVKEKGIYWTTGGSYFKF